MSREDLGLEIRVVENAALAERIADWTAYVLRRGESSLSRWPGWLRVLAQGLGHRPYCLEAVQGPSRLSSEVASSPAASSGESARAALAETPPGGPDWSGRADGPAGPDYQTRHRLGCPPCGGADRLVGILPLAYVRSWLFGRFLVGLPYLNIGGVMADSPEAAQALVDRAAALADRLDARYLELRHESPLEHPRLGCQLTTKVHMRLALPRSSEELWKSFDPKVRNQVRKGERQELSVHWGGVELLREFYAVFAVNMRDLGTPVFPKGLFRAILEEFPDRAELCVVRLGAKPVAGALLVHGPGMTEVPSASSLRQYNWTCANMLMYWHLLRRTIERGQECFDFGRSTTDSPTYRFKKQWGAEPVPAVWQYYLRHGTMGQMRPESGRFQWAIRLWRHLPVWLTRLLGPWIVRGIP